MSNLKLSLIVKAKLEQAKKALSKFRSDLKSTGRTGKKAGDTASKGIDGIEKEVDQVEPKIGKLRRLIRSVGVAAQKAGAKMSSGFRKGEIALKAARAAAVGLTAVLVGLIARITSFNKETDKLAKIARKLGIGVEALSKLRYAAKKNNIEFEKLAMGLQRATRRIAEAAEGTGEAQDALKELGLDAKELVNLPLEQQFLRIADAIAAIEDQSHRVRLGFKLFDSEGVDLVNIMTEGAAGVEKLMREVEAAGGVITKEMADNAEKANDEIVRLQATIDSFTNRAGSYFAEKYNRLFESIGVAAYKTTQDIDSQLGVLLGRLGKLQSAQDRNAKSFIWGILGKSPEEIQKEIDQVNADIDGLLEKKQEVAKDEQLSKARSEEWRQEREHNIRLFQARKKAVDGLKDSLKQQEAAYSAHVSKLTKFRNDRVAIATEFANLVRDLQQGGGADESDFIDAAALRGKAAAALDKGEFQKAIDLARQAAEILKSLKTDGDSSSAALQGEAAALERIANTAAQRRVAAGEKTADAIKTELGNMETMIAELEGKKVNIKVEVDTSSMVADVEAAVNEAQSRVEPVIVDVLARASSQDIEGVFADLAAQHGDFRR